ncbi:hypothetical protein GCM10010269_39390 [Streptomyces humidus]|uniref:Uncharacterized protein n=1 Tax=Streptomyces humidus TaxID=52259 RepID=A0A918FXJ6_9ACTN|nr:hypothetical protein GCM10010269_39390 [Streptomyces humidus]
MATEEWRATGAVSSSGSDTNWKWFHMTPAKTPTCSAVRDSGGYPASSSVCQAMVRNSLSWGSMRSASRREMPKNSGSKRSMPVRKPPQRP